MKVLRWVLIVLFAASLLLLVPSEKVVAEEASGGHIIDIPVEQTVMAPVNQAFYTDNGYEDPSLKITVSEGRAYDTDYMVIRVKIANPSQLRTSMWSTKGTGEERADKISARDNAVLAINGDSFRTNKPNDTRKYIIRQCKDVFVQNWKNDCYYDILFIDENADMLILRNPTRPEVDAFVAEHKIINSFCFGPALVIDGERQQKPEQSIRANGVGWTRDAQRIALCQMGPLEYMIVVTGGPDCPNCTGITIDEFLDIIYTEGSPVTVYNLDGGNSAWVVLNNTKINSFGRVGGQGIRKITDIIYFASAWESD